MATFTIDKTDWARGVSITENHNDGGFSPLKRGHNLSVAQGGILFPKPAGTDLAGATVVASIIAFTADPSFLGNDAYGLDTGGNFYTVDGATVTKRQTDAVKTYTSGTSHLKTFLGSLFATSGTDIAKLDGSDLSSIDHDWWTATAGESALQSSYRHPMEVVEDTLYIADQYRIHTYDGSTTVYEAMVLPSLYNITSMIVHTDGRHLLVFVAETANFSHTARARAKLFMIDTLDLEFIREIDIDGQVEGVINVGGVIYCTYGNNLGYFNGDGLTFLRKLANATTYSHNLANMEGTLLVRETNGLLAYGNLGLGNVFWYPWDNAWALTAIYYAGDNTVMTSSSDEKLNKLDFDTYGGAGIWDSNQYSFAGKVWIRKIVVESETLESGGNITFSSINKNGTAAVIGTLTFAADGAISEKTMTCNIYTDLFRLRIAFDALNTKGIRKITIHYEDGE